jgi:hypothetical protein
MRTPVSRRRHGAGAGIGLCRPCGSSQGGQARTGVTRVSDRLSLPGEAMSAPTS